MEGDANDGRITTATVLFCDLVGSTAQRTSLGDDAADQLAVALDRVLRGAVAAWRGQVVKSTGDGVMAVFDAASDALSAAVAIHQQTESRNRVSGPSEQLVLRIGLSAGDVQYVANDCHGTPVVEAARLEAAAETGSIYVSELVRLLAGTRGGHQFEASARWSSRAFPHRCAPSGCRGLRSRKRPRSTTARRRWKPRCPCVRRCRVGSRTGRDRV